MASTNDARSFVCSCFFTNNIFIKKYKLHVSYTDKRQFMEEYSRILRNKGCVTDSQFDAVIGEIETELTRRRELGSASLRRIEEIQKNYVPLHRDVYELQEERDLDPQFLALVTAAKKGDSTVSSLQDYMECEGEEVYAFPVFSRQFCERMVGELMHIEHSDSPKGRPNTMNHYGILLNEFGFDPGFVDRLREDHLQPLASVLYPTWGGHSLDSHKAFTVHYQPGRDTELACHYDNAEVTLNVALTFDSFTGGDLYFQAWSSEVDPCDRKPALAVRHRAGWGVLHRGLHHHGAAPVTSGRRCNLILWMRSSRVRNSFCPMCHQAPGLVSAPGLSDGFTAVPPTPTPTPTPPPPRLAAPQVVDVCQTL